MQIYEYSLKTIDPIFFAKESVIGALTPPYIHATALNHAVSWSLSLHNTNQYYIIPDDSHNRNNPFYESSWITKKFYLTPARPVSNISYLSEIAKGDGDKYLQLGYGAVKIHGKSIAHYEVLKAYSLFFIPPETELTGILYIFESDVLKNFPTLIRLGSFRGVVRLIVGKELKIIGEEKNKFCIHPVDPLVHNPTRGQLIQMLPYPIVEMPYLREVWAIRKAGKLNFIAKFSEIKVKEEIIIKNDLNFI